MHHGRAVGSPGWPAGGVDAQVSRRRKSGLNCFSLSFMVAATRVAVAARSTADASAEGMLARCLTSSACCRNPNSASACAAAVAGCMAATARSTICSSALAGAAPPCARSDTQFR